MSFSTKDLERAFEISIADRARLKAENLCLLEMILNLETQLAAHDTEPDTTTTQETQA